MLRAKRYQEAADLYRRALQFKPRFPVARYNLAITLAHLGNMQEALAEAENALRDGLKGKDKKLCQDWVRRLRASFQEEAERQKRVELARQAFNEGNRMYSLKRYAEAEAAFRRAFAYDPDASTASNLGLALNGERRFHEAEAFYHQAISLDPAYPNSYSNLGSLLLNQSRNAEAESVLRHAIQLGGDAFSQGNLAICLVRLAEAGDSKTPDRAARSAEAETLLRHALAAEPTVQIYRNTFERILLHKCLDLGERNDYAGVEAAAREAIKWVPQNSTGHNNLGAALLQQGRLREAEGELREAVRIGPEYAGAHNNLGRTLMEQGRLQEAEVELRQALRIDPNSKNAQSNLNDLLAKQAEQKPAVAVSPESRSKPASIPNTPGDPSESSFGKPASTAPGASGSIVQAAQRAIDQAYSNLGSTSEGLGKNTPETKTNGVGEEMAGGSRQVIDTAGKPAAAPVDAGSVRRIGAEKAVRSLVARIPPAAMNDAAVKTSVAWYARRESDKEETRAQLASVQTDIDNHQGDPQANAAKKQQLSTELKRIDEDQEKAKKAIQGRLVDFQMNWVEEPEDQTKGGKSQ